MTQEDKTLCVFVDSAIQKKQPRQQPCVPRHTTKRHKDHYPSRSTPQSIHTGRPRSLKRTHTHTHTHTHTFTYCSHTTVTQHSILFQTHTQADTHTHTHTHATRLCVFMPFALNVMKHPQHSRTYTSSHVWRQVTVYNVSHEDYGFIRQCSRTLAIEPCTHSSLYWPD